MSDTGILHILRSTPDPDVLAGNAAQLAAHGPQINTGDDDPLLVEVRADDTRSVIHVDVHYDDGRRAHLTLDAARALHIADLLEQKVDESYAAEFNADDYLAPDNTDNH